jgi:hypothetical protein
MTVQFIAPTPRKKISQKEAARLFLLHNGICCNCGQQIRGGEKWFIEHVEALVLGGADDDQNRRPSHLVKCKAKKDAADAAARSERDRHITKDWQPIGGRRGSRPMPGSRASGIRKRMNGQVVRRP